MHQTPPEFKKLADSAELYDRSEAIGAKFGLLIDQVGELDAEIRDILNGVSESEDFIKHIMQRLEINKDLAEKIVAEVNVAVFQTLREQMQAQTAAQETQASISNIERVGGFSIEKDRVTTEPRVTAADRSKILDHLENPPIPASPYQKAPDNHTEPLVDHLLQNSVGQLAPKPHHEAPAPSNLPVVEETPKAPSTTPSTPTTPENPKTPSPQPPQQPQPRRSGPDPYRETVN